MPCVYLSYNNKSQFCKNGETVPRDRNKNGYRRGLGTMEEILANVDYVPPNVPPTNGLGKCNVLDDNEAVIKMSIKTRAPTLHYVTRTQSVDLSFIFCPFQKDPGLEMNYINTKMQIGDLLTKGQFTAEQFNHLLRLAQVGCQGVLTGENMCQHFPSKNK